MTSPALATLPTQSKNRGSIFPKSTRLKKLEERVAMKIPHTPNQLSTSKLIFALPLMVFAIEKDWLWLGVIALALHLFLDFADGSVARHQGKVSTWGRFYDRISDYPLVAFVAFFAHAEVSVFLVGAKFFTDAVLGLLYLLGYGSSENRTRSILSNAVTVLLVGMAFSRIPTFFENQFTNDQLANGLLSACVLLSSFVVLFRVGVLQKRFVADALSMANLISGVVACVFALQGSLVPCLLLLGFGALCDGLDGYCARRFGGTRIGVLADDIADGVSYGLAPAIALGVFAATQVGIVGGVVIGISLFAFTSSRLLFFTLRHGKDEPGIFRGVPSTLGGLVVYASLQAFSSAPLMVGFFVGAMAVLMVGFDTRYPHLGRALTTSKRVVGATIAIFGALVCLGLFSVSALCIGLLLLSFGFVLFPMAAQLRTEIASALVALKKTTLPLSH
ncbi:MAG: hypothetical protein GY822_25630 [Deltaproteobacteria bacterium]|nr:hypothetical protein [Deltaproteobacteria bacterium]